MLVDIEVEAKLQMIFYWHSNDNDCYVTNSFDDHNTSFDDQLVDARKKHLGPTKHISGQVFVAT